MYTGSSEKMMNEFKREMMQRYEMSDLGLLHYGIGVLQIGQGSLFIKTSMQNPCLKTLGLLTGFLSVDDW